VSKLCPVRLLNQADHVETHLQARRLGLLPNVGGAFSVRWLQHRVNNDPGMALKAEVRPRPIDQHHEAITKAYQEINVRE
jgi:hypothetical protein